MVKAAREQGAEIGLEDIGIANGLSFAAVTILYELCKHHGKLELFLWTVEQLNSTNLRASADMLAGQNSHPRAQ